MNCAQLHTRFTKYVRTETFTQSWMHIYTINFLKGNKVLITDINHCQKELQNNIPVTQNKAIWGKNIE